jgi:hypothetical protein
MSFEAANSWCSGKGMSLAIVESEMEWKYITSQFNDPGENYFTFTFLLYKNGLNVIYTIS